MPAAIEQANAADTLAAQAQLLADDNVRAARQAYAQSGTSTGADLGGIIIGGLLSGMIRGGGRNHGGRGSHGGGWNSTTFGGSGGGFSGGGGRF